VRREIERLKGSFSGDLPPFFAGLPAEARDDLMAHLRLSVVPAGDVVVREGDEGDCYYFIAAGQAEVWARKRSGPGQPADACTSAWVPDPRRHTLIAHLGPGDGFGEMALLLGGRRRATVRAATELRLYAVDGATFSQIVSQHRGLAIGLEEEMTLRGVALSLRQASPFTGQSAETLRWLALRLRTIDVEPGQEIVRQGNPGDALFIVRSGCAEVVGRRTDGTEYQITTLGPGDPFGEAALLTGEPRSATVRALEQTALFRLSAEDYQAVLSQNPERRAYFAQLMLQRQRPRRCEGMEMERQEGQQGETVSILKDPRRHRYIRLSDQAAFLWDLMDGEHSVRDLTVAYFNQYKVFGLQAVIAVMLQLYEAGFLRIQHVKATDGAGPAPSGLRRRMSRLTPWLVRYFAMPDVDKAVSALYRYVLWPLYTRLAQALLFLVAVTGVALFLHYLTTGGVKPPAGAPAPFLALATALGLLVQIILHEVAHAVTCKHFGREVHKAGIGWYFFLPVGFVDTSDIWMEGRGPRAAVAFAGPYTNFLLSGLAMLLIPPLGDAGVRSALFQIATTGYVVGVLNLNPLMEFDGYYVLMDWLDVPNLRRKALAFVGTLVWRVERPTGDRRLRRLYLAYGWLALLYTVFVAWTVFTGYQSMLQQKVRDAMPPIVAGALGWAIATVLAILILQRAWTDLRSDVRQAA
jgi:putative peptide zinc metalloprotease protein